MKRCSCAHAGGQLAGLEGFGYVVICAKRKADHRVCLFIFGRKEDDRHIRELANPSACFEAVHLGHHDIKDEQVEIAVFNSFDSFDTIMRFCDFEALWFEYRAYESQDRGIIVGYQEPRHEKPRFIISDIHHFTGQSALCLSWKFLQ